MTRGRPREFDEKQALEAALDVFWRKGYEGASCEELLSAMGINCGSMYAAFGDKQTLYDRAFDLYCNTVFFKGMGTLDGPGTPLENVRAMVECMGEHASSPERKGCMVSNTLIEFGKESQGVVELAKKAVGRLRRTFEAKLAAAKEIGELDEKADPKEIAAFLVNMAQGLSVSARAGVDKEVIRGIVNTTLALLR